MTTRPRPRRRGLIAAGVALLAAGSAAALASPVQAGEVSPNADVFLRVTVEDPGGDAQTIIDGLTPELFTDPGGQNMVTTGMCSVETTTTVAATNYGGININCSLPIGQAFRLGDANPPAGFSANDAGCEPLGNVDEELPGSNGHFTLGVEGAICGVTISPTPTLYVDKVVSGGDAASSDFEIELYDVDGTQVDIGTVTDPSNDLCSVNAQTGEMENLANCVAIPLANGYYTFGEVLPDYGYVADVMNCRSLEQGQVTEKLRSPAFDFLHSAKAPNSYCILTNAHVTDTISVDLVVVNDSGRDADPSEFEIEIYDNAGNLVDSKADPEPGTGNASAEFTLPIGPYTLGFSGPDGYVGTAEVVVDDRPRDQIPGTDAQFTLGDYLTSATITVDDEAIVTTTAAPTTVAPTTAAPVVTVDPNAVLPATGSNSTTWPMMLLALGLMAFGGATVAATRRH